MTKRTSKKSKSEKNLELKLDPKKLASESELATISLPTTFPFQDLTCLDEHKKLFENLFNGTK